MDQAGCFGPLCPLTHAGQQYLCYTCPKGSTLKIHLTNAADLWSAEVSQEALEEQKYQTGTVTTEDYSMKLREAFDHGNAALTLQDSCVSLNIKEDTWTVTFELFKQPISETKAQIQALVFSLVARAGNLEKRLQAAEGAAVASCSPEKSLSKTQRQLMPGMDSRKGGRGGPPTAIVKRIPGESLINPGIKRKKAATGVDFEEP